LGGTQIIEAISLYSCRWRAGIFECLLKHPAPPIAEVTDLLAALGKSLGAFSADPNRSLGRLAPVSHDERMNRFE
jgi:hypothetical protein